LALQDSLLVGAVVEAVNLKLQVGLVVVALVVIRAVLREQLEFMELVAVVVELVAVTTLLELLVEPVF
tara:strand:- start:427 stop:630 length:204 start_codon:yes stop_codon:yes gene_type:complete